MLQFETFVTAIVMAAWLLVLAALYRLFRRQAVEPLHAGLAAAAFTLGLLSGFLKHHVPICDLDRRTDAAIPRPVTRHARSA